LRRSSIVYHELKENWFRTVMKLPYRKTTEDPKFSNLPYGLAPGYSGAHTSSVLSEGNFYGNPLPGKVE